MRAIPEYGATDDDDEGHDNMDRSEMPGMKMN